MNNKLCHNCKTIKSIDQFNKKTSRKDKVQANCKDCTKLQCQSHYSRNKDYYLNKNRRIRKKIQSIIADYKDVPCADCGIKYPYYVMDFDHISQKSYQVSQMTNCGNPQKVLDEITKCEVVCANCHRIRTRKKLDENINETSRFNRKNDSRNNN